jgi:hypothetical protein
MGPYAARAHVLAGTRDARLEQRTRRRGCHQVQLALLVVAALGLVVDDRVVALDGLLDHPVGILRVGARDDAKTRGVGEVGLVGLAVVLDRADAAADGDADHHGQPDLAQRTRPHLGDLADDLVERGVDEPVELDLHDGTVAAQRHTDGGADDAGLGQRGVDDPVLAEVLLQVLGDPEHATELADVLTHDDTLGSPSRARRRPALMALPMVSFDMSVTSLEARGVGGEPGTLGLDQRVLLDIDVVEHRSRLRVRHRQAALTNRYREHGRPRPRHHRRRPCRPCRWTSDRP